MRVLFFGRLRDIAGAAEMEIAPCRSIAEARALASAGNRALAEALAGPGVRVAIDQVLRQGEADLQHAGELAFMPPMSGG